MQVFGILLLFTLISCNPFGSTKVDGDFLKKYQNEPFSTTNPPSINDPIIIGAQTISNISDSSFDVKVEISGDENYNSTGVVYFCSETDSPGCDPLTGKSKDLGKFRNFYFLTVDSLNTPYDPGDTLNVLIQINDSDGITGDLTQTQVTLDSNITRSIYRSVQYSYTTPVVVGGAVSLTISNSTAVFSSSISLAAGVGDALTYDSTNDGVEDSIAFITERIDSQNYKIQRANGANVSDMAIADSDWRVYRAYTSLSNAENGSENPAIPIGLRNFDNWSGGRDLVSNHEQWNIALYSNGSVDTDSVSIDGWETSPRNNIKIFTPSSPDQTSNDQTHEGVRDNNFYSMTSATSSGISILENYVTIDGLQLTLLVTNDSNGIHVTSSVDNQNSEIILKNLIVVAFHGGGFTNVYGVKIDGGRNYLINNVIYGFDSSSSNYGIGFLNNTDSIGVLYNNTLFNNTNGITISDLSEVLLKNNIVQGSTIIGIENNGIDPRSSHNLSNLDDGSNLSFRDADNGDFALTSSDTQAVAQGLDLSSDALFAFDYDTKKNARVAWDVGAISYIDYAGTLTSWNELGTGSIADPYVIANTTQLIDVADKCSSVDASGCTSSFKLIENLDFTGITTMNPIGALPNVYGSTFDCNNKTISNLTMNLPTLDFVGLFGNAPSALIKNCIIDNFDITGRDRVGVIAGRGGSVQDSSILNSKVTGDQYVGGVIGEVTASITLSNLTISSPEVICSTIYCGGVIGSSNTGNYTEIHVTSGIVNGGGVANNVGGIIGYGSDTNLSNSSFSGAVTGANYLGGIIGRTTGTLTFTYPNLESHGTITASGLGVGGIFGLHVHGLSSSFTSMDVSGTSYIGGAVGHADFLSGSVATEVYDDVVATGAVNGAGTYVGGLIGQLEDFTYVRNSYATGKVTSSGVQRVGGLVGYYESDRDIAMNISDSYSFGDVYSSSNQTGGFVGASDDVVSIFRSSSFGDVYIDANQSNIGGFVGLSLGSINSSSSHGNVKSEGSTIGGFAGSVSNNSTVQYSYATGNVSGIQEVGGFSGAINIGTVRECFATGDVEGQINVSGFTGSILNSSTVLRNYNRNHLQGSIVSGFAGTINGGAASITHNYSNATFDEINLSYGFAYSVVSGTFVNNYWNSTLSGATAGTGSATFIAGQYLSLDDSAMKNPGSDLSNLNIPTYWEMSSGRTYPIHQNTPEGSCLSTPDRTSFNDIGLGTNTSPYIICNAIQFNDIGINACNDTVSSDCASIFTLGNDIDFTEIDPNMIGGDLVNPFTGVLLGRGHKLLNYKKSINESIVGIFRSTLNAKIIDLKIENIDITGINQVGALIGSADGGLVGKVSAFGRINLSSNITGDGNLVGIETGNFVIAKSEGNLINDNSLALTARDLINSWDIGGNVSTPSLSGNLHPICQANIGTSTFNALGSGIQSDPYQICFKEQLQDIYNNGCNITTSTNCDSHFEILNDIDLSGILFYPIGHLAVSNNFQGTLNGNGNTLYNLTMTHLLGTSYVGLFKVIGSSGRVLNLNIDNATVNGLTNVGILSGQSYGHISNVRTQGIITSGGINTGGIVGTSELGSYIENSRSNIIISSSSGVVGGITGSFRGDKFSNSSSYGEIVSTVSGNADVGGLIGVVSGSGIISNSSSSVSITASSGGRVGGLIGSSAISNTVEIHESWASGNVTGDNRVGGFVGDLGAVNIYNSYALGNSVATASSGNGYVGGFVGYAGLASGEIHESYANGDSIGIDPGGFIGFDGSGVFQRNYWNSDNYSNVGSETAGEYEELTSVEMQTQANFSTWDFSEVWMLVPGMEKPIHRPKD